MQRFALRVAITMLAVALASSLFRDLVAWTTIEGLLIFALLLGILNAFLRPILLLLSLPLTLLTLGLFTFVVNAIVFWLATLVPNTGVTVTGFGGAFLGALVVSVVSFLASRALK